MTYPVNYQNSSVPAYSGITINITNPTLNAAPMNQNCPPNCPACVQQPQVSVHQPSVVSDSRFLNPHNNGMSNPNLYSNGNANLDSQAMTEQGFVPANSSNQQVQGAEKSANATPMADSKVMPEQSVGDASQQAGLQSYPPQYYLNNYNYIQNGEKMSAQESQKSVDNIDVPKSEQPQDGNLIAGSDTEVSRAQEEDLSSSKEIIEELDSRVAEQKELEKNGKKTRVIALTNEYIMSLENYLNNPNTEIRLMAAKEVLTRLDEDKARFDDAALNALLNKMLQDPEKLVRIAALSAFSSQLASGNDYTVQLLTKIQNNPNADKEDVLQAADSLLKMSSRTEIRYTPVENQYVEQQVEQ